MTSPVARLPFETFGIRMEVKQRVLDMLAYAAVWYSEGTELNPDDAGYDEPLAALRALVDELDQLPDADPGLCASVRDLRCCN